MFLKELNLGAGVRVTLIPPQKNITITGGAGGTVWYNVSVNGKWRVYWTTEYAGMVYAKEELKCSIDTLRIDDVTLHIIRLFFINQRMCWASAWLVLLPAESLSTRNQALK